MATNFQAALAIEIEALEQELEADPRFMKLRELRRVQALYGPASAITAYTTPMPRPRVRAVTSGRSPSPERQSILDAARMLTRGRALPVPTADLHDQITAMDIVIPGTNPKNNLSAMLSNSPEFKSHGRAGWTLNETPEASDDQILRSASEAPMSSPASPAGESSTVRPVDPVPGGGA